MPTEIRITPFFIFWGFIIFGLPTQDIITSAFLVILEGFFVWEWIWVVGILSFLRDLRIGSPPVFPRPTIVMGDG
jgi:hypothetical protein